MKISLVGSGRVAFHLAKALLGEGHNIVQVYARDFDKTQKFAEKIQAKACQTLQQFQPTDLIILTVSDSAIAELVKQVHEFFPDTLIVTLRAVLILKSSVMYMKKQGCFIHYKHLA